MKRCPNCQQSFSDDLVFCLNDGTVLENSAISYSGDIPTIVVPPKTAEKTNKSFYVIIGAMAIVIIGLSAIVFFLTAGSKDEKKENNAENKSPNIVQTSPTINRNSTKTENRTTILNPKGKWAGTLSYPWGAVYSAVVDLTDDGSGQISGKVVWTCTANPKKADEIGTIETEIVQGTFDLSTRMLSLKEDTNDPNDLGSRYKLTLAEDNSQLNGFIFGRRKRWNLNWRRF